MLYAKLPHFLDQNGELPEYEDDRRRDYLLGKYFEGIAPKYREYINQTKMAAIDTAVLEHQIPGGMISNLVSQLREANALDRIDEVYEEIPRCRKEMGYPPLVTPTSQIVGIQAVQNVLFGRYKVVSAQVKDYMYGLYGQPPAAIDENIRKMILKGYERGETPVTCRPADVLEPEMEKAKKESKDIAKDMGDTLIYALYPTTGMRFLKWKYGKETPPPETKGKTLEDIKKEDELIAMAKEGKLSSQSKDPFEGGLKKFKVYVGNEEFSVGVEPDESPIEPIAKGVKKEAVAEEKPSHPPTEVHAGETPVLAPMPGMIIKYAVKVGDEVKSGDTVVVLEAMKMEVDLPSPADGKIKEINFKNSDHVARDDVLATIG